MILSKENIFKFILIILSTFVFAASLLLFLININATTDQNYFRDFTQRFYVTKEFAVRFSQTYTEMQESTIDMISIGDLIEYIDNKTFKDTSEIYSYLRSKGDSDIVKISYLKAKEIQSKEAYTRVRNIPENFISYIDSAVIIIDVEKGGASDLAGIKVGDIILSINGQCFPNMFSADSLMRSFQSGSAIDYELLRNNHTLICTVYTVKIGAPFWYIFLIFTALNLFIFSICIGISRYYIKAARIISFCALAASSLLFFSIGMNISKYDFIITIRPYLETFSFLLLAPTLIYLSYIFPYERREILNKKILVWIPYIFSSFVGSVYIINKFIINIPISNWLHPIIFINNRPIILDIVLLFFIFFKIIIDMIFYKYRKPEQKKVLLFFKVAFVIFILYIIFSDYIYVYFYSTKFNSSLSGLYVSNLFILLILGLYLYIIVKYKLLDIQIKIRKNTQYIFTTVLWKVIVIATIVIFIVIFAQLQFQIPNIRFTITSFEILKEPISIEGNSFWAKIIVIIGSLLFILLFWRIDKRIQKTIDNKFFRNNFDFLQASSEITEIIDKNLQIKELSKEIITKILNFLYLKKLGIIVYSKNGTIYCQNYIGLESDEFEEFINKNHLDIFQSLKNYRNYISVDYLPEKIKSKFLDNNFNSLIPIYTKEKLIATIIVGEKLSETSFTKKDVDFLTSLSSQLNAAIENSLLYEDLANQERIKKELEIARQIQLASLPQCVPDIKGIEISGISLPAYEVGGDFYDFLNGSSNDLTIIIGDVSGKGTSSALYMSKTQGIIRTLNEFDFSPKQLLIKTNNLLNNYIEKKFFITVLGARFYYDKNKMKVARAGHLPLYYYNSFTKQVASLSPKGMGIGLTDHRLFDNNLDELEIGYSNNDVFLFCTDGVIDAMNNFRECFGEERLIDLLLKNNSESADKIKDIIIKEVHNFASDIFQFDDLTVVVVKIKEEK